jgi:hypothetical protein
MAAIDDLVTRGMSGVLEIDGNPSGRVYLDGGQIAYARASWVPGLAARLRAIAPSLVSEELPSSGDAGDAAAAELVVGCGYLTTASLHELIKSIVVDAFLVLTIPLAEDYSLAAIRFTQPPASWPGLFPRLSLAAVRDEAVSRAERMAEDGLAPTTCLGSLASAGLCTPVPRPDGSSPRNSRIAESPRHSRGSLRWPVLRPRR